MRVLAVALATIVASATAFTSAQTQTAKPQEPPLAPTRLRSSTDGVNVPVSVFDGSRVVTTLQLDDFELRDNDVRQTISTVDFSTLPVSLRLVFDISGSISEEDLERYQKAMRQVTEVLEPRDVCEIITFDTRIADAAARQSPPVKINIRRDLLDGTAFFDAVTLAMLTTPTPDRRRITIILSDAKDNTSFFDETTMIDAARATDAVVYTILPGDPANNLSMSVARLRAISLLTGGHFVTTHQDHVGGQVIATLKEFRHAYFLRYQPTGVQAGGWHKLEVKVRGGHKVRYKAGYFSRAR